MTEQMYLLAFIFYGFHPLSWTSGSLHLHCLKIKSRAQSGCVKTLANAKYCLIINFVGDVFGVDLFKMLYTVCFSHLL